MKVTLLFVIIVASSVSTIASTKTITILGDQKVRTQWDGKMPKAMSDQGIETNVTGIIMSAGKMVPTFGFDCSTKKKLLKVRVEDVTGKEAILMVEDQAPMIERAHWKGNSSPCDITPKGAPWLFTHGDTVSVFRFSVFLEGDALPVVIYQPSVFPEASKVKLVNLAVIMKGANHSTEPTPSAVH